MNHLKDKVVNFVAFSRSSRVILLLLSEIGTGLILTVFMLWIFFHLADEILEKEVISFDTSIVHLLYSFRTPIMTEIMKTITFFGGPIFIPIAIVAIILILFKSHKKDALIFSFILIFGLLLNLYLKDMFHRPRPTYMPLVHERNYSFPSGHAMNSTVFFLSLSYFIFLRFKNKNLGFALAVLSGISVLCIGISRIYLGAHFPSDVIAGFAAGILWFTIVLLFEKSLSFYELFKKYELEKRYDPPLLKKHDK